MSKYFSVRFSYFIALLICVSFIAFSIYLQTRVGLQPCALCELQRFAIILLGLIFVMGACIRPQKITQLLIGSLAGLASLLGVILSGRQVWLQHLPANTNVTCAADLQYMLKVLPFDQVLTNILKGSAECAQPSWQFLSVTLAEWSLIAFCGLLVFSIWQSIRK